MSLSHTGPELSRVGVTEKFGEDSQSLDGGSNVVNCEHEMRALATRQEC